MPQYLTKQQQKKKREKKRKRTQFGVILYKSLNSAEITNGHPTFTHNYNQRCPPSIPDHLSLIWDRKSTNRVQNHAQHHRFKVLANVTLSFSPPVNVNLEVGNQAKPGDLTKEVSLWWGLLVIAKSRGGDFWISSAILYWKL